MEHTLTLDEARAILSDPTHDAYGTTRLYGETENGIVAVKSTHYLDKYTYSRVYAKTNNGMIPVRRA